MFGLHANCNGCPLSFQWVVASKEIFWVSVVVTSISEISGKTIMTSLREIERVCILKSQTLTFHLLINIYRPDIALEYILNSSISF